MKIRLVKKRDYKVLERLYREFEIAEDGDICVAVGGDGTAIGALRDYDRPILPIRTGDKGSLGFYADVTLEEIDFVVESLKTGRYVVEPMGRKLEITYDGRNYYAVNEAVLKNIKETVYFKVYKILDGKREPFYKNAIGGDGLLVCTLIGSTAYNRNANGPILDNPDDFCVTFLNSGGPVSRNPIVTHMGNEFYIEVVKGSGALSYDNADVIGVLNAGDGFHVRLSERYVNVVRFPEKREPFADKLERLARHELFNDI